MCMLAVKLEFLQVRALWHCRNYTGLAALCNENWVSQILMLLMCIDKL